MLQHVSSEHFQSLLDQPCPLYLPDGSQLQILIEAIEPRPKAQLPEMSRVPFNVQLHSLHPTDFVDGLCNLELPGIGLLEGIFVSREPALGRDQALGYFNIVFN
ncbi:hypothetical protein [Pseudomonas vanderleydeniana]|uniref:Uncharacterized protein n=1 Tax=Pseudomonas vanderleydeniana TaxID=2745495 RepID=A0A9E6TSC5_9PSED|nr:hypothetical protein [Pseudomonas vanderleydeniana]QXI28709.1 hypothetical protein HU752_001745 [Pseudomonas vanderleydeniana]